jgi:hypothetical protein
VAREQFFRHAAHVWPRLLRIVRDELDRLDHAPPRTDRRRIVGVTTAGR